MKNYQFKYSVFLAFTLLCVFSILAGVANAAPPEPVNTLNIGKLFFGMVVVLMTIAVCAWAYKKIDKLGLPNNSCLNVESLLSLGNKEKLMVVRSDRHRLLISVTPGNIKTVLILDDAPLDENFHEREVSNSKNVHSLIGALRKLKDSGIE